METPQISIIIPTYKPKDYLWECLESIERQTLNASMFEVVVVLNGCKEPYLEKIKKYAERAKGLQVRILQTDQAGVSNARNLALKQTKTPYVCFIDDDDWVSPNYLEALLAQAADDCVAQANVKKMDENTREEVGEHFQGRAFKRYNAAHCHSLFHNRSFFSSACCKLIPRHCIQDNLFDPRIKRGEDSLFMFSLSWAVHTVKIADASCIYYVRHREGSANRRKVSFMERLSDCNKQIAIYTQLYLRHIKENDFRFYLSRIVATFIKKVVKETIWDSAT